MKKILISFLLTIFHMLAFTQEQAGKQEESNIIYTFNIREEIDKPVWRKVKNAMEEAVRLNAKLILIRMNTYGGRVDIADSIRTKILLSPVPVAVLIENNAASAGALISVACDSIYMMPGSTIGAATVVDQSGKPMPDKYQSYMRKKMRSTAEYNHRDPDIAEAMVDPDKVVPGISDSGKVVTFTTSEAIEHNFCEAEVSSPDEIIARFGYAHYNLVKQKLTLTDAILDFLTSSMISGLLIMIIIGGIYFELQTPGIGFPLAAAVIAALLYFAPLYLEGLAENWEILLFIAGLLLIGMEIFVIPGFGIAGVSGAVLLITGLVLSLLDNQGFDFSPINADAVIKAIFTVIIAAFLSLGAAVFFTASLIKTNLFAKFSLQEAQSKEQGYVGVDPEYVQFIGKEGIAATVLRPSGKVEIEGQLFDATSETGYIEPASKIVVISYEKAQLIVTKKDPSPA